MIYFVLLQALATPPSLQQEQATIFSGYVPDPIVALSRRLNRFESIYIPIPSAPGTGHQMANINAIRRLRHLGYEGQIIGAYHPDNEGILRQTFSNPFPNLTLIEESRLSGTGPFVLSAATDEKVPLGDLYTVRLQPWLYPREHVIHSGDKAYKYQLFDNGIRIVPDQEVENHNLRSLLTLSDSVDMMPVYPSTHADKLNSLYTGVQLALAERPELFPKVPILVLMGYNSCPAPHCISLDDPRAWYRISEALQQRRPIMVGVGRVSSGQAKLLYKLADLPPTVYGVNSMSEVLSEGKPFMSFSGEYPHILKNLVSKEARDEDLIDAQGRKTMVAGFKTATAKEVDAKTNSWFVSQFLIASRDPDSTLASFFERVGGYHKHGDRITDALITWAYELDEPRHPLPPHTEGSRCLEGVLNAL